MDYMMLLLSAAAVACLLAFWGGVVSIISTYLQCQKWNFLTPLIQGVTFSILPSVVYLLAVFFISVRSPFANTLKNWGVYEQWAEVIGVGYLVMLASWISVMWNIHNSEKAVCQSDVKEMTEFKKKLLAELAEKEAAKEANANAKQ
jgi:hypothetical protein